MNRGGDGCRRPSPGQARKEPTNGYSTGISLAGRRPSRPHRRHPPLRAIPHVRPRPLRLVRWLSGRLLRRPGVVRPLRVPPGRARAVPSADDRTQAVLRPGDDAAVRRCTLLTPRGPGSPPGPLPRRHPMLCGYAYLVDYPRRPGQSYVCCDARYVADDVAVSVRNLGWAVQVHLIAYRGPDALSIMTTLSELVE